MKSNHSDQMQANTIAVSFVETNAEHAKMSLSMGQLAYVRDAHKICLHDGVTKGGVMCFTGVTPGMATQYVGTNGITTQYDPLADKLVIGLDLCPALPVTNPANKFFVTCDAAGNLAKAQLATNAPPDAVNDSITLNQATSYQGSVATNDSDPNGGPLAFSIITPPAHGTVIMTATGAFQYIPDPAYFGPDSFNYMVRDNGGLTSTASVSIIVVKTNNLPTIAPDSFSTPYQTTLSATVATNDTDVDGDPLTYSVVTGVAHGNLQMNINGSFIYTPLAGYSGPDSFTYQVDDGHSGQATATVTIVVNGLLTASNDTVRCTGYVDTVNPTLLQPTIIHPLTNDTDSAGRPFVITAATLSSGLGIVTHDASSITFTPSANQMAQFTISYTITNNAGDVANAVITCLLGQVHYNSFGNLALFVEYGDGVFTDMAGNIYTP